MQTAFHTFTASDGIHTDAKQVRKYVSDFWPVLQDGLDKEKLLGDATQRVRKIDVVQLGKLFDEILAALPEEQQDAVVSLMDEFVRELE